MCRGLRGTESGQSTVELALAMPLVLCVLIGAVQFALVHHAQQVASTAASEGARLAASEGRTLMDGAVRAHVLLEAGLGRHGDGFRVSARERAGSVAVTAAGSYPLFIPWVRDLAVPVEARAAVRREGFRGGP